MSFEQPSERPSAPEQLPNASAAEAVTAGIAALKEQGYTDQEIAEVFRRIIDPQASDGVNLPSASNAFFKYIEKYEELPSEEMVKAIEAIYTRRVSD